MKVDTKFAKESFTSLPSWAKGIVTVAVVGGVGYLIYKLIKSSSPDVKREKEEAQQVEQELADSSRQVKASYPKSVYQGFANRIEEAGFDLGTDEEAIYNIFRKIKNNTDFLMLQDAWGKPNRTIYDWGMGYPVSLSKFLTKELSASEISKINSILRANKITKYQF